MRVDPEWVETTIVALSNWGRIADGVPPIKSSDETCFADDFRERVRHALAAVASLIAAQERKRITEALHAEADATPCAEDAAVVRDCADLVEADFSYERAEEIAAIRALKETT